MNSVLLFCGIQLILGILLNVFTGKISYTIFKNSKGIPRVIIRVVGIFLVINPIMTVFK